jgi:hypothetical protein
MGSRTVFSTLYTQTALQSMNPLGIGLAFLWILSPMGGQSALRIVDTTYKEIKAFPNASYFNTYGTPSGWAGVMLDVNDSQIESEFGTWNTLYTASLLASSDAKFSNLDLWGNVKIPFLSSYSNNSNDSWINVSSVNVDEEGSNIDNDGSMEYSSLIGIPIIELQEGNTTLYLESTYVELDCATKYDQYEGFISLNSTELNEVGNCDNMTSCQVTFTNGTFHGVETFSTTASRQWGLGLDTFIDPTWVLGGWFTNVSSHVNITAIVGPEGGKMDANNAQSTGSLSIFGNQSGIVTKPGKLLFQAGDWNTFTAATCALTQVYIESKVLCSLSSNSKQNCSVTAQRPSRQRHPPETITLLSFPQIFTHFSTRLPIATVPGDPNLPLLYIIDTSPGFMTNTHPEDLLNECSTAVGCTREKKFSQRLGQLINSYLLLSQAGTIVTGPTERGFEQLRVKTTNSNLLEVYAVSIGWLCVFILGTLMMLLAGIAGIIIGDRTFTPEILGYCSLGIRDSKLVDLPLGGGTLDGIQMTRLLQDLEVKFGVVEESPICGGKLGIGLKDKVSGADENSSYI